MALTRQPSFAAGEVAPSIQARPDLVRWQTGLATCRNFIVLPSGGVRARPGTTWVGPQKDHTRKVRLWPFVYSETWRYVLEFGHQYLRFHKDGRVALSSAATTTITGITNANPAVITVSTADIWSTGDEIRIDGVLGMPEINGRHYKVTKLTSTTYSLQDQASGANVDSTGFGTYASDGTAGRPVEVATPYQESDLPDLQFSQHGGVLTIVHPNYPIYELIRVSDTVSLFSKAVFGTLLPVPDGITASGGPAGSKTFRWKLTAVSSKGFEETLPARESSGVSITAITNANPAQVTTSVGHGLQTGDEVFIQGVVGMTEVNGRHFIIKRISGTQFQLVDEDSTSHGAYSSGGTVYKTWAELSSIGDPTSASPVFIRCNPVDGAIEYNVYRQKDGVFGYVGTTSFISALGFVEFQDIGYTPDMLDNPPIARYPFVGPNNWPRAVGSFQRRRWFGGKANNLEGVEASRMGLISNFHTYFPSEVNDPIVATLVGKRIGRVRHILDVGKLLVFTESGEWLIEGDASGLLSPTAFDARQYSYFGSDRIPPLVVDGVPTFVQKGRTVIRDLVFSLESNGFSSSDLTVFSSHLFDGYTIEGMAFAQGPYPIIWIARSDGTLLGLTIVRNHQVLGWHRHDTDGVVEEVTVMPEKSDDGVEEDRVYMSVRRTIGGATRRYIERLDRFSFQKEEDLVFCDASVRYDGRNTGTGTITISGGTTWGPTELLTLTGGSGKTFESSEVGSGYFIRDAAGDVVRFSITQYINSTTVKGFPHKTVPVSLRNVAVTTWTKGTKSVYGLWHLEGKLVSVQGDGYTVANPFNPDMSAVQVSGGKVTLATFYGVITVGLPYVSDFETLDLDSSQNPDVVDVRKLVQGAVVFLERSGPIWSGAKPPSDGSYVQGLTEHRPRESADPYAALPGRFNGPVEVDVAGSWLGNPRVFVRRLDPHPVTIHAIAPQGVISARG